MINPVKAVYDWLHPAPETVPLTSPESRAEADSALAKASTDLNNIIRQKSAVTALSSKLLDQGERNHFGELVEASMRRA
jgi:hypothetical protein